MNRPIRIFSRERRDWIRERINEGKVVQVAVTYTNTLWSAYLTTSGRVCTREHGYIEDVEEEWEDCHSLPFPISWASVERMQRVLEKMCNE